MGESAEPGPVARNYELRLESHHQGVENTMTSLAMEMKREGEDWEHLELDPFASPFLAFLHAAFNCQLSYLRMNAVELGLQLECVRGFAQIDTLDFAFVRLNTSFAIELLSGDPSADDLAYLGERCLACPISKNLAHVADKTARIQVGAAHVPIKS